MTKVLFYTLNFIGISVYFLFNRKDNPDSLLLMAPYFLALATIVASVFNREGRRSGRTSGAVPKMLVVLIVFIAISFTHGLFRRAASPFSYGAYFNSFRRYFGTFIFYFAFVALDRISGRNKVNIQSYLKFVVLLVAGEAIIESILLNTRVISLNSLPIKIGTEDVFDNLGNAFRPYGLLGATSALGTFLVMLFSITFTLRAELPLWAVALPFVAFMLTFSYTAYGIFAFLALCSQFRLRHFIRSVLTIALSLSALVVLYNLITTFAPNKAVSDYFFRMTEYWQDDLFIYRSLVNSGMDFLLGAQHFDAMFQILSQDTPYVSWLGEMGFLGLLAYTYLVVNQFTRRRSVVPPNAVFAILTCIYLGMLHYPIIIFIPTQVFLGCMMHYSLQSPAEKPPSREGLAEPRALSPRGSVPVLS